MMYLVEHLSLWLFLTAVFAGLAGWAFAAQRGAPREASLRRQRDTLVQDLGRLAAGEGGAPQPAMADPRQSLADVGNGRMAELERDRDHARARASEAMARIAELERRLEQQTEATIQPLVSTPVEATTPAAHHPEPSASAADESDVLQGWRLRYFEQRVRYLERRAASAVQAAPGAAAATPPLDAWRAREAAARADYLEQQLRRRGPAPAPVEQPAEIEASSPFASNAEVDTLLRWRMLYLERRLAHAQTRAEARPAQAIAAPQAPIAEAGADLDRWKWRARYLESRVRHLTSRLDSAQIAQPTTQPQRIAASATNSEAERAPPAPAVPTERPPALPGARNGAPDDFTLIEGVSALQQSTLNSLGVYHFDQIAAWTPANVAWVDQYLRLRGRIGEEEWIEQAQELAADDDALLQSDAAAPQPL
jgi:predicted flap endonuclease-1-like 5' DNA nuclease